MHFSSSVALLTLLALSASASAIPNLALASPPASNHPNTNTNIVTPRHYRRPKKHADHGADTPVRIANSQSDGVGSDDGQHALHIHAKAQGRLGQPQPQSQQEDWRKDTSTRHQSRDDCGPDCDCSGLTGWDHFQCSTNPSCEKCRTSGGDGNGNGTFTG